MHYSSYIHTDLQFFGNFGGRSDEILVESQHFVQFPSRFFLLAFKILDPVPVETARVRAQCGKKTIGLWGAQGQALSSPPSPLCHSIRCVTHACSLRKCFLCWKKSCEIFSKLRLLLFNLQFEGSTPTRQ